MMMMMMMMLWGSLQFHIKRGCKGRVKTAASLFQFDETLFNKVWAQYELNQWTLWHGAPLKKGLAPGGHQSLCVHSYIITQCLLMSFHLSGVTSRCYILVVMFLCEMPPKTFNGVKLIIIITFFFDPVWPAASPCQRQRWWKTSCVCLLLCAASAATGSGEVENRNEAAAARSFEVRTKHPAETKRKHDLRTFPTRRAEKPAAPRVSKPSGQENNHVDM